MSPLPILQDEPKIRPSRASKWRALVLVGVHVIAGLHIAYWLRTGSAITPVEPSEAMAFAKGGMINAGLIFFAATILLTAIFGRFFCGWGCHLVALQDLCRWLLEKIGIRPAPLRSRLLMWVPMIAFVYMFLWPVAYRLWIGDSFRHVGWELTTTEFWATFPGWVVGGLTFLTCGFVIVYFLGAKGFCTYGCPYGAIFGVAEKISPLRIRVTDACEGCGHCTAVCTSNVRVHQEVKDFGMVIDSGCMKCLDCVSVCPNDALYYGAGPLPIGAKPRVKDPKPRRWPLKRWQEILLAGAFAAAFFTFRGLYGAVPFLMALGLAAILAYLVLVAVDLVRRPAFAFKGLRLKQGGKWLPAGYGLAFAFVCLFAFWAHSAVVRTHAALGERGFRETAALRQGALDATVAELSLEPEQRSLVLKTRDHLERVRSWGLVEVPGMASKLAWLNLLAGYPQDLKQQATRAIEKGEEVGHMHQLLAREAWQRQDLGTAKAAYERAIAAEPLHPAGYLNLGIVLAQSGDLAAADAVFERAWQKIPGSSALAYNGGLVKAYRGDTEGAIRLFERALALNSRYLEARENLAGVLAGAGRFEESAVHYRRALLQAPQDASTHFLLARVLVELGEFEEAEAEARETLRLQPGSPQAQQMLEQILSRRAPAPPSP